MLTCPRLGGAVGCLSLGGIVAIQSLSAYTERAVAVGSPNWWDVYPFTRWCLIIPLWVVVLGFIVSGVLGLILSIPGGADFIRARLPATDEPEPRADWVLVLLSLALFFWLGSYATLSIYGVWRLDDPIGCAVTMCFIFFPVSTVVAAGIWDTVRHPRSRTTWCTTAMNVLGIAVTAFSVSLVPKNSDGLIPEFSPNLVFCSMPIWGALAVFAGVWWFSDSSTHCARFYQKASWFFWLLNSLPFMIWTCHCVFLICFVGNPYK